MDILSIKSDIKEGRTALGIEFGSTRIKAVLIGSDYSPIASGSHDWENKLVDGVWTYDLSSVWEGLQDAYAKLRESVDASYGLPLTKIGSIGFSAMMHGYLVFDKDDNQLAEFRTWRNTMTGEAADALTKLFSFNIPQRWSIAHLYQAILNNEAHVPSISFLTTLAGYVHWKLTGKKVLGVGEASGVFPIDSETCDYDGTMVDKFNVLLAQRNLPFKLTDILPTVLNAGDDAGTLTPEGALLIDPTGTLEAGSPLAPPEGDAGTGMAATNSVAPRTGNVSAGTSIFSMVVLEKPLEGVYPEIDMVTTPTGKPVAMVHCNNCCSDLDSWVALFKNVIEAVGAKVSTPALYDALYFAAEKGDVDCGGLLSFNNLSGEPVAGLDSGRPLFVRKPDAKVTLSNFMRAQLYATMATLKIGMDILFEKENVTLDTLLGHGGLFKTERVGQQLMANAMNTPVTVMATAGEGGAWGMALLAAYRLNKADGEKLEDFLANSVFGQNAGSTLAPIEEGVKGFNDYMKSYKTALAIEKAATESF
ncbi:MAG: FGGY-family carbohydrate kinase [Clostridia bacterium]|nr:FGGY-family carbohydrate kinase [Clostridia bacterium]